MTGAEVRAAALQAAVALAATRPGPANTRTVVKEAERLEVWILEGVLPKPPSGMMD